MQKLILFVAAILVSYSLSAQVPQGFSYQAVARDAQGTVLSDVSLTIQIAILDGETLVWQEEHELRTTDRGLFSLTIGDPEATNTGGSALSFSDIPWGSGSYMLEVSVDDGGGLTTMGSSQLMSVPYALFAQNGPQGPPGETPWSEAADTLYTNGSVGIGTSTPNQSLLTIQSNDPQVEKPLFEVKNDDGIPVFAVYNDGVIVYVDDSKKGVKGGFAVGGYNAAAKGPTQEYLRITPDSVRIWVPETLPAKGQKGGFAVGGYNASSKGEIQNLLEVTSSNTSIYFDTTAREKGQKGGFAVGGYNAASKGTSDQLMSLTRQNYLIGQDAGSNITTGKNNTFFGWKAGLNNTTGDENIFVGKLAGFSNVDAYENIFIGNESGYSTESGYGNVYIGNQSGYENDIGYYNSIIGYQAGYNAISHFNTFLGYQAGYNNTDGLSNISIGFQAGYGYPESGPGVEGFDNIFLGYSTGAYTTTGSKNIFMGAWTGLNNTVGDDNVFLGNQSGYSNISGENNIFIGSEAGFNNEDGLHNIFLGTSSGYNNADGNYNVYMGFQSGFNAGFDMTDDPSFNTLIGYQAGYTNVSGEFLTLLGARAGLNSTGGSNTFLGAEAGFNGGDGHHNTFVGVAAGSGNTGNNNTTQGAFAGFYGTGDNNVLIGASAGQGASPDASFSHNTFVGKNTGLYSSTGGSNTYIGYEAGNASVTAFNNLALGFQAGYLNSAGIGNVFLGYQAGYNETGNDKLYVANSATTTPLIYGDFGSGELTVTGNAGVNYGGLSGYGLIADIPSTQIRQYAIYSWDDMYVEGVVYQASDKAYKENIVPVENAISKLKQVDGVYFDYANTKAATSGDDKRGIGVIAQDVEKVFPDLVKENMDGNKAVNYTGLIPVLIEAIKDQQTQIELQQKEIDLLKAALNIQ